MRQIACVALGANLGAPQDTVAAAFTALGDIASTQLLRVSSLYCSAPVGLRNQPDFINAAATLAVDDAVISAPQLLQRLFAIEAAFGRVRSIRNAPRTLDLDLLLFGDLRIDTPQLTLPHPRMAQRAFVLEPLHEIAPTLVIPGLGALADLLPTVAGQRIERLAPAMSGVS